MAKLLGGTRIYGNATVDTNVAINGGNVSSSTTTGALTVIGGVGITGNLYVGNTVVSAGVDLIANVINLQNQITGSNVSITNLQANVGAYELWANANLATQTVNFNTLNANVGAFELYANANIGTIYTHVNTLDANVGSYEIWNNANASTMASSISTLQANVGAYEIWANSALGIQSGLIASLNANVGAFELYANANLGTATTNFNTLNANVGAFELYANANLGTATTNISVLQANVGAFELYANANLATQTTNFNTLNANVGAFELYANANLGTATVNISTLQANVGSYEIWNNANASTMASSISTLQANVGAFELYANANLGTATTNISTLQANVGAFELYANANLGTATVNISTLQANVGAYEIWANANLATQTTNFNTLNANVGAFETYANSAISSLYTNANANTAAYLAASTVTVPFANVANYVAVKALNTNQNFYVSFGNTSATGNTALGTSSNLFYNPSNVGLIVGGTTTGNIVVGNLNATNLYGTLVTSSATITGGAISGTPISGSTGSFTTLATSGITTHNGNVVAASGTASGGTTTGALVVVGGAGVSGALNVGGISQFSNGTAATGLGTGALQVTNGGGASIAGNLWVGGNVNFSGNLSTVTFTGSNGQFFGNTAGDGALYAGIASGYLAEPLSIVQSTANQNNYAGVFNGQNINSGSLASTDIFLSPNNGTLNDTYLDIGIASSTYSYPGYSLIGPNDAYLFNWGNSTTGGGNLILGTGYVNDIVFAVQGINTNNEVMRITSGNVVAIKSNKTSTNTTTGALTVAGGVGIAGNLYAGAILATPISGSTGNFTTAQANNFSTGNAQITGGTLNVATAQATNFSTANAQITGGAITGTPISGSTGSFTTLTAGNTTISGNLTVTGTLTYINTTTEIVSGVEIVAGNLVANSGATSTNTTTGALVVAGGAGVSGAIYAGSIQNTPIGSTTASTGNFTTLTATSGLTTNTVSAATIGNVGANGIFTTLTSTNFSSANAQITTAQATNFSTANAQITGGAITGTPISGSTGNFTTLQGTNFSTANAQITGGTLSGLVNVNATTLQATNFSSGNVQITGGSISGIAIENVTTLSATNFSSANVLITGGNIQVNGGIFSTLVSTNLSSGNAQITGGAISGASGSFTTLATSGITTHNGNVVAASGTASTNTTTGALVVVGGMGVGGNVNTSAIYTDKYYFANGMPFVSTVYSNANVTAYLASGTDATITAIQANVTAANAAIVTANNAVVSYVNTLNSAMSANVAGANAAIVTANNAVVGYVNTIHALDNANVIAANAAIVTANNAVVSYVNSQISTVNSYIIANTNAANAAIVTANNAVVSYVNSQISTVNSYITANTNAANAAIVTANNAVVSYVNTLNSAMVANVTATNAAIVTANNAVVSYVNSQINLVDSYITANTNAANAAIVTANNAVVSYVNSQIAAVNATAQTLTANVGAYEIWANNALGIQSGLIASLNANVGAFEVYANSAITTANAGVVSYINSQIASETANVNAANAAIITANNAVVSYVNTLNTAMIANVAAANAAITTANAFNKSYTDTAITNLINLAPATLDTLGEIAANLAIEGSAIGAITNSITNTNANVTAANVAIATLQTQVYSNSNVASYLTTASLGSINSLSATFRNGDPNPVYANPQITFGYNNTNQYPHFVHTTHNAGVGAYNTIGLYTSDGTQNGVFPTNGILGLTVSNGQVGIGNTGAPAYTLDVTGNARVTGNVIATNFTFANGVNILSTIAPSSTYSNANVASYLPIYSGNIGGTLTSAAQSYITSLGTLTGLTVNGGVLVSGAHDATLLKAVSGASYDQVLVGGNGSPVRGAKLQVNSTDSILLPAGSDAQRPSATGGTDTQGMLRYSTTSGSIEWFTGAAWVVPGSGSGGGSGTVSTATDNQFTGNGVQTYFGLSANATTASALVSINGILQIPSVAYTVTGNTTLAFTEAPATTDIVDVRILPSLSTTFGNANVAGYLGGTVLIGNVITTSGVYWANGTAYSSGSIYSNANVTGYLASGTDSTITAIQSNVTAANAAIASVSSAWQANASTLQTEINSINANVTAANAEIVSLNSYAISYINAQVSNIVTTANANTAAYLPTYSGSLGGTITTVAQPNITSVGTLSSLTSTGIVNFTNSTDSTSYSSGALVVAGGVGIGGELSVRGNIIAGGNINFTGNVNSYNFTTTSGTFNGNAAGFGALYAGIPVGNVFQPQTTIQVTSNFNGYAQLNQQNINNGALASSDFIATANNGNSNDTYIDMGIASSNYNYPGFGLIRPNDGYLITYGNAITGGGNLLLATGATNDIIFATGGVDKANEAMRITSSGVAKIETTVSSTSTTTGALVVSGGVGVAGNVFAGSVYASSYFFANGMPFVSGSGGSASTGNFTFSGDTMYDTNGVTIGTYATGAQSYITLPPAADLSSPIDIVRGTNTWGFTYGGALSFPDSTQQYTAWTGSLTDLVNGSYSLVLNSDGTLSVPLSSAGLARIQTTGNIQLNADGALFTFTDHNTLVFPDGSVQSTAFTGTSVPSNEIVNGTYALVLNSNGSLTLPDSSVINGGQWSSTNGLVLQNHDTDFNLQSSVQAGASGQALIHSQNDSGSIQLTVKTDSQNNNITIVNNTKTWTFGTNGEITTPQGGAIGDTYSDGHGVGFSAGPNAGDYAIINSHSGAQYVETDETAVYIGTNYPVGGGETWTFNKNGVLTLPGGGTINDSSTYGTHITAANSNPGIILVSHDTKNFLKVSDDGIILDYNDHTSTHNTWFFDGITGNLTFPDGTTQTTAFTGATSGGGSGGGGSGGGTINQSIYFGKSTVTTAPTLIDTLPVTGNTAINWTTTSVDNVGSNFAKATIDSLNDGANVYYTQYAGIKSNTAVNVAVFTSNITGGNINLWATGVSNNVNITFERTVLGADTPVGYLVGTGGTSSGNITGDSGFTTGNANVATTVSTTIDTFDSAAYTTAKYLVQASFDGNIHSTEMMVITNGVTTAMTQYATLYTAGELFTANANISGNGLVSVNMTVDNASTVIDFKRYELISRINIVSTLSPVGDLMIESGSEDLMIESGTVDLMS